MPALLRRLFGFPPDDASGAAPAEPPDDASVKVILGLGNPGPEYANTRHNVGWWVLDHLADVWRVDGWTRQSDAHVATALVAGGPHRAKLVKPLTYMNLSGAVLRPYLRRPFWSPATDLLVVVDEIALPVGRYRFRAQGSPGGHNGLKSIQGVLGHAEYPRLRVGVGPSDGSRPTGDLADFVLDDFDAQEARDVRALCPTLADAITLWVREGIVPVMNRYTGSGVRQVDSGEE